MGTAGVAQEPVEDGGSSGRSRAARWTAVAGVAVAAVAAVALVGLESKSPDGGQQQYGESLPDLALERTGGLPQPDCQDGGFAEVSDYPAGTAGLPLDQALRLRFRDPAFIDRLEKSAYGAYATFIYRDRARIVLVLDAEEVAAGGWILPRVSGCNFIQRQLR